MTVETLFSVTTVSRQIKKRLLLKTTFQHELEAPRLYIDDIAFISFIAFVAHRFIASIFWRGTSIYMGAFIS